MATRFPLHSSSLTCSNSHIPGQDQQHPLVHAETRVPTHAQVCVCAVLALNVCQSQCMPYSAPEQLSSPGASARLPQIWYFIAVPSPGECFSLEKHQPAEGELFPPRFIFILFIFHVSSLPPAPFFPLFPFLTGPSLQVSPDFQKERSGFQVGIKQTRSLEKIKNNEFLSVGLLARLSLPLPPFISLQKKKNKSLLIPLEPCLQIRL